MVFTGGSGPTAFVGSGTATVVARRGKEAWAVRLGVGSSAPRLAGPAAERRALSASCLAGPVAKCYASEASARCAWQGSGQVLRSETARKQIGAIETNGYK